MSKFDKALKEIMEATTTAPAPPKTVPTAPPAPAKPAKPYNPIRRPAPGRKAQPKAIKRFFDQLKQKHNL